MANSSGPYSGSHPGTINKPDIEEYPYPVIIMMLDLKCS